MAIAETLERRDNPAALDEGAFDHRAAAMDAQSVTSERLEELRAAYEGVTGQALLEALIKDEFAGEIAAVSSFGAESAVLLHMVAQVDPTTPVIFLNTGKLFGETLRYRDRLQDRLGLADLRSLAPHPDDAARLDPDGDLWSRDPDACCFFRKVAPLERALEPFAASITGRKRFQTGARARMETIEEEAVRGTGTGADGAAGPSGAGGRTRFKINPLAHWTLDDLNAYAEKHKLPDHPLVKDGYLSIGCMPCTQRVPEGGGYRDGRWAGQDKDECGIHTGAFSDGDGI